jgi:hypothetical protein
LITPLEIKPEFSEDVIFARNKFLIWVITVGSICIIYFTIVITLDIISLSNMFHYSILGISDQMKKLWSNLIFYFSWAEPSLRAHVSKAQN